jgi:hypothetical protein
VSDRAKEAFAAALWDGARYTVASDTGRILVGADGRTWSAERSPSAAWLRALTSFAGLRVAVGDAGAVLTSSCAPDPRVRRRLIRVP